MTQLTGVVPPAGAGSGRRWRVLAVTGAAVFLSFLDVTIVNIAFPSLRADFTGTSLPTLSWVLNGYGVAFAAALIPAGRLADRVGRRRVFLYGIALFVLSSTLCGVAPSPGMLIAARAVQALGAAAIVPTSLALLLPEFPLAQRATATAIWGATGAVAAATGPALGGVLVDLTDWRLVFFVNLPLGLATWTAARRLLVETADPDRTHRPDWTGAAVLAGAVGALTLGIVQGPSWGWTSRSTVGSLTLAAVLLAAFLRRCARHPAPVVDLDLFRVRSFRVANVGTVVFAAGFFALLLCNVLFLTGLWQLGVAVAGVALTPGALTAAAVAPFGGRIADRAGQRAVVIPGALLFAAGTALLATRTTSTAAYGTAFLPAILLTGAGIGLTLSAFGSAAVAELPRERFATGSAVTACFRQIGGVLGIATLLTVLGDAPARLTSFHAAWWAMSGTGGVAALCGVALGRVRARDVTAPGPPAVPAARSATAVTATAGPSPGHRGTPRRGADSVTPPHPAPES